MANQTTQSIRTSHWYAWIPVLNHVAPQFLPYPWHFTQAPNEVHQLTGRQPQSVAKGWNDGIAKAKEIGCDYVLVINEDIVLKSDAIDNLIAHADAHPEAVLWSMGGWGDLFSLEQAENSPDNFHEHPNFSSFLVRPDFLSEMGTFDENYRQACCEDNDMHARIALSGKKAYITGGAWFYHFGSRTMAADPQVRENLASENGFNGRYFTEKWGHGIVGEVDDMRRFYYPTPYNEADKPLSYWRGQE